MNERIKALAGEARLLTGWPVGELEYQIFAELIIQDCVECCVLVAQAAIDTRSKIDTRGKELDADFSYWHGREDAASLCKSAIRKHFEVEK